MSIEDHPNASQIGQWFHGNKNNLDLYFDPESKKYFVIGVGGNEKKNGKFEYWNVEPWIDQETNKYYLIVICTKKNEHKFPLTNTNILSGDPVTMLKEDQRTLKYAPTVTRKLKFTNTPHHLNYIMEKMRRNHTE